jgi:hypothetical protein
MEGVYLYLYLYIFISSLSLLYKENASDVKPPSNTIASNVSMSGMQTNATGTCNNPHHLAKTVMHGSVNHRTSLPQLASSKSLKDWNCVHYKL